jgi:hypothetical protein
LRQRACAALADTAFVLGEEIGLFADEDEVQFVGRSHSVRDDVLRGNISSVFDLNGQVIGSAIPCMALEAFSSCAQVRLALRWTGVPNLRLTRLICPIHGDHPQLGLDLQTALVVRMSGCANISSRSSSCYFIKPLS